MTPATVLTALALTLAAAAPSFAQEQRAGEGMVGVGDQAANPVATTGLAIYGGGSVELSYEEYGAGTGTSLSGEIYIEGELNGFYLGANYQPTDEQTDTEIDLYLGYRQELPTGFKYDIGYTRYYYPNDGWDCCGELTLGLFSPVGDKFGLGTDLAYDPDNKIGNAYIYGEYYPNDIWTVSVNYGSYEIVDAASETEWDIGATYAINDKTGLDFRWYDGTDYDGYFAVAVNFDATLFQR